MLPPRSGIFGASQILGNINGGSDYLYGYIESKMCTAVAAPATPLTVCDRIDLWNSRP